MKLKYYLRGLGIGIITTVIIMMIAGGKKVEKLTDNEIIQRAEKLGMVMQEDTVSNLQEDDSVKSESEVEEQLTVEDISEDDIQSKEETSGNNQLQGEASEADKSKEETSGNNQLQGEASEADKSKEETSGNNQSQGEASETDKLKEETSGNNQEQGESSETAPSESESSGKLQVDNQLQAEGQLDDETTENINYVKLEVKPGDPCYTVAKKTYEAGLVDNIDNFNAFLKAKGIDRLIRVGVYSIPENATYEDLAKIFTKKPSYRN